MTPLKKGQPREEDRYMWGCGRIPHPHIYPSPLLEGSSFSALIYVSYFKREVDQRVVDKKWQLEVFIPALITNRGVEGVK